MQVEIRVGKYTIKKKFCLFKIFLNCGIIRQNATFYLFKFSDVALDFGVGVAVPKNIKLELYGLDEKIMRSFHTILFEIKSTMFSHSSPL